MNIVMENMPGSFRQKEIFSALVEHYEFAGFSVIYGTLDNLPQSNDDILVFLKYGVFIETNQIVAARSLAIRTGMFIRPYSFGGEATKESTDEWLQHRAIEPYINEWTPKESLDYAFVVQRQIFEAHGEGAEEYLYVPGVACRLT